MSQAVCQFRFPTLVELDNDELKRVAKALRARFPFFEPWREPDVRQPGTWETQAYQLRSPDESTRVAISASMLSIETNNYVTWEAFREDVAAVVNATQQLIDSKFYTFVGLRLLHRVHIVGELDTWINPALNTAMMTKVFGMVRLFMTEVHGMPKGGGAYVLRYGVPPRMNETLYYTIDSDFSDTGVEVDHALTKLDALRIESDGLYDWCLTDLMRDGVNAETPSGQ